MSIELLTAIILNIMVHYVYCADASIVWRTERTGSLLLIVGDQMRKYERLRNLREDFDMTQSEVGAYLHISQRSYAHYEAGTRDIPLEILIELANLYQVNLDYLVGRTNVKDLLPYS